MNSDCPNDADTAAEGNIYCCMDQMVEAEATEEAAEEEGGEAAE
jgi:hypothetical protein